MGGLAEQLQLEGAEPSQGLATSLGLELPAPPESIHITRILHPEQKGRVPEGARTTGRGIAAPQAPAPVEPLEAFARGTYNPFNISAYPVGAGAQIQEALNQTGADTSALAGLANPDLINISRPLSVQPDQVGLKGVVPAEARTTERGITAPLAQDSQVYEQYKKQEQEQQDQAARDQPLAHGAGQGLTQSIIAAPLAEVPALTALGRAKQAAKIWGPMGALASAGQGVSHDEPLSDVAVETAVGGVTSAAGAAGAGEAGHVLARAPGAVKSWLGKTIDRAAFERGARHIQETHGKDFGEAARQLASPTDFGAQAREDVLAGMSPEAVTEHAKELEQHVTGISQHADVIKHQEDIASKGPIVASYMAQESTNPIPAIQSTDQLVDNIDQQVKGMLTGPNQQVVKGTPDANFLDRISKRIQQYKLATKSPGAGVEDASQRFLAADQVKRELQRAVDDIKTRRDSPIVEQVSQMADDVLNHLEDPQIWGTGPATMQSARNQAWRSRLQLESADVNPNRLFLKKSDIPSQDPYRPLRTGEPAGLHRIVQNVGDYTEEPNTEALKKWAQSEANLGSALTSHIEPNPELVSRASEQADMSQQIHDILGQRANEKAAAQTFETIRKTPAQQSLMRSAIQKIPVGLMEAGALGSSLAGSAFGNISPEAAIGTSAAALGMAVPVLAAKSFLTKSTPEGMAQHVLEMANLERQVAQGNPAAKIALDRLNHIQPEQGRLGSTVEQVGRVSGAQAGGFTGDQMSRALTDWALKNPDKGEGNTTGQDLTGAVQHAIQNNPASLGRYADQLRNSKDLAQELFKLHGDPNWTRNVLPHLHNLVSQ